MRIRYALRAIRFGIRSRLFICVATITTAYSACFANNPSARVLSLLALLVSSELMIFLWGNFLWENFRRLFPSRKTILWEELPIFDKFRQVAVEQGVKLNNKRSFGIGQNLDNAYAKGTVKGIV